MGDSTFAKIDDSIWGVQNILETDHEMIEFDKNFPKGELSDSGLIDEFSLAAASDLDTDIDHVNDIEPQTDTNQDDAYYLI